MENLTGGISIWDIMCRDDSCEGNISWDNACVSKVYYLIKKDDMSSSLNKAKN